MGKAGYVMRMYTGNIQKLRNPLIISVRKEPSSEPSSSFMSMADIRMEGAGMCFSKEVLIRCCHPNLKRSLIVIVRSKGNGARKRHLFIRNLITYPHFYYLFSTEVCTALI